MKIILRLCLVGIFFLTGIDAQAQIFKKLKERIGKSVERKVEERIEREADKKTDQVLDTIFDKKKSKRRSKKKRKNKERATEEASESIEETETTGGFDLGGMMDVFTNPKEVKYESQYQFPITATMEVTNKETTPRSMRQSYGVNAMLMQVEETPGEIITDFPNETMIMLDIEKATAQIMSMAFMSMMGMGDSESLNEDQEKAVVEKTGNTKMMHGYTCYEYFIRTEDTEVHAWFAPEVNFNYQDYLRGFAKTFAGKKASNPTALLNDGYGYVMEMSATTSEGDISTMKVTNISEEMRTINLSDYKIQKL